MEEIWPSTSLRAPTLGFFLKSSILRPDDELADSEEVVLDEEEDDDEAKEGNEEEDEGRIEEEEEPGSEAEEGEVIEEKENPDHLPACHSYVLQQMYIQLNTMCQDFILILGENLGESLSLSGAGRGTSFALQLWECPHNPIKELRGRSKL